MKPANRKRTRVLLKFKYKIIFFVVYLLVLAIGISFFLYSSLNSSKKLVSPLPLQKAVQTQFTKKTGLTSQQIEAILKSKNISYVSVNVNSDTIHITVDEKSDVLFSSTKNIVEQVTSLQLIVSRLTIEGKRFKRLDFRYNKPVVVFQ